MKKLNPSNPEGLTFGARVYSDCLDEFSPSDKDGSPVKIDYSSNIILSLIHEKDHQKFYNMVIAFMNEKEISEIEAFLYITFNQMIENVECKDIYKYFDSEYYNKFRRLMSCCNKLYELLKEYRGVINFNGGLECRAANLFFKLYGIKYEHGYFDFDKNKEALEELKKALITLNPSNPEGLN